MRYFRSASFTFSLWFLGIFSLPFSTTAGTQAPREAQPFLPASRCRDFLERVRPVLDQERRDLSVSGLSDGEMPLAYRSGDRGSPEWLVNRVFDSVELQADLDKFLQSKGGLQSPDLWNFYFRVYDRAVLYSDGYQGIVLGASDNLPRFGLVVDYGAGTGNFSSALSYWEPRRRMYAIDTSGGGLSLFRLKHSALSADSSLFEPTILNADLKTSGASKLGEASVDGAVMNNVLYAIPPDQRGSVLERIFQEVKPGAIFVLNDARRWLQESEDNQRFFLTSILRDSVFQGSGLREVEAAIFTDVNRRALIGGARANPFLTENEMRELILSVGFEILEQRTTYYGATQFWVLRRPLNSPRG